MELEKGCMRVCVRHGRWEKKGWFWWGNASFSSGVNRWGTQPKSEPCLVFQLPPMGIEPTTFALGRQRTTIVLRRLDSSARRGEHDTAERAQKR